MDLSKKLHSDIRYLRKLITSFKQDIHQAEGIIDRLEHSLEESESRVHKVELMEFKFGNNKHSFTANEICKN
jgi:uncharacterized protein (DUF2126 family)